jgi:hypothetical protein
LDIQAVEVAKIGLRERLYLRKACDRRGVTRNLL